MIDPSTCQSGRRNPIHLCMGQQLIYTCVSVKPFRKDSSKLYLNYFHKIYINSTLNTPYFDYSYPRTCWKHKYLQIVSIAMLFNTCEMDLRRFKMKNTDFLSLFIGISIVVLMISVERLSSILPTINGWSLCHQGVLILIFSIKTKRRKKKRDPFWLNH